VTRDGSRRSGRYQSWVTDIIYIRTHEGWLYLAVVLDLFSRQVIDWSMGSCIGTELALNVLPMPLWRRQPKEPVLVHSIRAASSRDTTGKPSCVITA